jgi:hypothetical protein
MMPRSRTATRAAQAVVDYSTAAVVKLASAADVENMKKGLAEYVGSEILNERGAWMGVANALFTAREWFVAQGLSIVEDFTPWAVEVTGKGNKQVDNYLNGRRAVIEDPTIPANVGVDACAQLARLKTVEERQAVLAETGGKIMETRKAVSAMKDAEKTDEQRAASEARKKKTLDKKIEDTVKNLQADVDLIIGQYSDPALLAAWQEGVHYAAGRDEVTALAVDAIITAHFTKVAGDGEQAAELQAADVAA